MGSFEIRESCLNDVEELFQAVEESREHVAKWMPWLTPGYGEKEAKQWIEFTIKSREEGTAHEFLIVESSSGEIAGACGLNSVNKLDAFCNLGYWVRKRFLGQGAALQATNLLRDFGFEELGLNRLEIVVAEPNVASRRVAEKSGAVYEGIRQARLRVGEKVYNAHMYALIREGVKVEDC